VKNFHELVGVDVQTEEELFSRDYQQLLCKTIRDKYSRNVLWVIDEAHIWFDTYRKAARTWLALHGHDGQEVWLIAQQDTMISRRYASLAEYEWRAKSGVFFDLPFYFLYQKLANRKHCGFGFVRKSKRIYDAYRSFDIAAVRKERSLMLPAIILFTVVGGSWFLFSPVVGSTSDVGNVKKNRVEGNNIVSSGPSKVSPVASSSNVHSGIDFSGLVGNEVLLQEIDGGSLLSLSDVDPELQLVELNNKGVRVWSKELGFAVIGKKFVRNVFMDRGVNKDFSISKGGVTQESQKPLDNPPK
jgi:hypothetical protein